MADGLDPERVRWALADPDYGPWLRALVHDVSGFSATGADEYLWNEEDEPRIRELVDEALAPKTETPEESKRRQAKDDTVKGTVPFALAEEAVRLHVRDGSGRRTLERDLPGLGDWGARRTLYWYKVGKPAGLWLDEDDRLCWGPAITPIWDREQDREQRGHAIAPTPAALRLPRP
jgi:hypothetical protein